jgi:hypothetical protein
MTDPRGSADLCGPPQGSAIRTRSRDLPTGGRRRRRGCCPRSASGDQRPTATSSSGTPAPPMATSPDGGLSHRRDHSPTTLVSQSVGRYGLWPAMVRTIWDLQGSCWKPLTGEQQIVSYGNADDGEQFPTMPYPDRVPPQFWGARGRLPLGSLQHCLAAAQEVLSVRELVQRRRGKGANLLGCDRQALALAGLIALPALAPVVPIPGRPSRHSSRAQPGPPTPQRQPPAGGRTPACRLAQCLPDDALSAHPEPPAPGR